MSTASSSLTFLALNIGIIQAVPPSASGVAGGLLQVSLQLGKCLCLRRQDATGAHLASDRFRHRIICTSWTVFPRRQQPRGLEGNAIRLLLRHRLVSSLAARVYYLLPSAGESKGSGRASRKRANSATCNDAVRLSGLKDGIAQLLTVFR